LKVENDWTISLTSGSFLFGLLSFMIVCYKRWDQIIFVLRMLINLITKFSTHTSNHTLANLVLPWGDQQWNLYVTYTVNMDEVWATLMGPEYSVGFNQCSVLKQFSICHFLNPNHFQDLLVTLYIDIKAAMLEKNTSGINLHRWHILDFCLKLLVKGENRQQKYWRNAFPMFEHWPRLIGLDSNGWNLCLRLAFFEVAGSYMLNHYLSLMIT
jgi:hypothetical protein